MPSITNDNFGPLVAYLVPGATVLLGWSPFSPTIRSWFAVAPADAPTIGGFLYLTVASLAAGMIVSAMRWAVVDPLLGLLGVRRPALDFSKLGRNVDAFVLLIEIHYRHYQFYANMLVATPMAYLGYRASMGYLAPVGWPDLADLVLEGLFLATARNTLGNYYARSQQLLSEGPARPRRSARRR